MKKAYYEVHNLDYHPTDTLQDAVADVEQKLSVDASRVAMSTFLRSPSNYAGEALRNATPLIGKELDKKIKESGPLNGANEPHRTPTVYRHVLVIDYATMKVQRGNDLSDRITNSDNSPAEFTPKKQRKGEGEDEGEGEGEDEEEGEGEDEEEDEGEDLDQSVVDEAFEELDVDETLENLLGEAS